MRFYNPATNQIVNLGQLRLQYGLKSPEQARTAGFFEFIDKIENYGTSSTVVRTGEIFRSGDKYIRVAEPIEGGADLALEAGSELAALGGLFTCVKSVVPDWDSAVTYSQGSFVKSGDTVYTANRETTNEAPPSSGTATTYTDNPAWTDVF